MKWNLFSPKKPPHRNFSLEAFIKTGLFSLSVLVLGILAVRYFSGQVESIAVFQEQSERKLPIYCVDCPEKKVSLSFDAAWGAEDTEEILSILKKHDVHVTFFMTGGWVSSYPDMVKKIKEAGHDLGNHSENHKQMSQLSLEECQKEIQTVHDRVKELTGADMCLFRPPYGDYNNTLIEAANSLGYHTIQWDVDSLDWKDYGVDSIVNTVLNHKHLGSGSIILCHNGSKYTAKALDALITGLKDKGYELVKISDLIYKENYKMDVEGRQFEIRTDN